MEKTIFVILLILGKITHSDCQIRFSQFYSSPLLFNPANTGRFNKSYRIGGTFRNEKNAQGLIHTQGDFFLDSKILTSKVPENDCFSVGVLGLVDEGRNEGIKNTYVSFSAAYQKGLDEEGKQQIGIGFQTTFAHNRLDKPILIFEDQILSWANSGYSNIDIFQVQNVNVNYTDVNAGLIYQGITNNNFFSAGVSMYHITEPYKLFTGGQLTIFRQTWSHLSWESNLENDKKLYVAFLIGFSKQKSNNLFTGFSYQIKLNRNYQIDFGGWFKRSALLGNSLIPSIGLNFGNFKMTTSYDINISSKQTSQRGAGEISMIYTNAISRTKFLENKFIKF